MTTRDLSLIGGVFMMTMTGGAAPRAASSTTLTVCHAGSLTAAFARMNAAFSAQHPDVTMKDVAGGSVSLARQLATGDLPCDLYASADYLNVDLLLKPARLADYTIVFAGGRMVLAYLAADPKARGLPVSGDFNPPASVPMVEPGWYRTLLAPGVRIAGAHPFLDPGGYRSHLIFELAQTFYHEPLLYNGLLEHYTVIPADPTDPAGAATLGREFNFQLTYEHGAAAAAKNNPAYRYARLPDRIDLSNPDNNGYYAQASVTIPGLGLKGDKTSIIIPGSRAAWGLTIPSKSPNQELAAQFAAIVLGPVGTAALQASGLTPIVPATVAPDDYAHVPALLQPLVRAR